jgi:regulator of replication initiation timing
MKREKEKLLNLMTTLSIAYHNAGVESEYMENYEDAMKNYEKGFEVCKKDFGTTHPLTGTLK